MIGQQELLLRTLNQVLGILLRPFCFQLGVILLQQYSEFLSLDEGLGNTVYFLVDHTKENQENGMLDCRGNEFPLEKKLLDTVFAFL